MLLDFLNNKPLFYDVIDYTRMPRAYAEIKNALKVPKIIHIIGTNGKGTTGRFLATALHNAGFITGHYTSPHILNFSERIWINGEDATQQMLEQAHTQLLTLLSPSTADALSYFEYTTLLALMVYQSCEYVVLEAGLGGEHDATAVFENILTLITPIDKDHQAFLGNTIQEIATTKINAVQKVALIAKQPHTQTLEVAQKIAHKKNIPIQHYSTQLTNDDKHHIAAIAYTLQLPLYLQENLSLAIAALNMLGVAYTTTSFNNSKLFGRLTPYKEHIYLDVGHNPLAAHAIKESLQRKKVILIYNTYKDKAYHTILEILRPNIKHIEIIDVEDTRILPKEQLIECANTLGLRVTQFQTINPKEYYLVFGSFSVVETFLKKEALRG